MSLAVPLFSARFAPPETTLAMPRGKAKHEHVLKYLSKARTLQVNYHREDDYQIAWSTVYWAWQGVNDPWAYSFWRFYGCDLQTALIRWEERETRWQQELAKLDAIVDGESEQLSLDFTGEGSESQAELRKRLAEGFAEDKRNFEIWEDARLGIGPQKKQPAKAGKKKGEREA